jgi:hypothetical protein
MRAQARLPSPLRLLLILYAMHLPDANAQQPDRLTGCACAWPPAANQAPGWRGRCHGVSQI